MGHDEGLQLLNKKLTTEVAAGPAERLLKALDYMPLAISHAAAYINQRHPRITVDKYTQQLITNGEELERLLSRNSFELNRDRDAPRSILATWQISFEHIRRENRSAADLLSFMSFFNPQGIPEFMPRDCFDGGPDWEHNFEENLSLLTSYSLVKANTDGALEMHRLVQFATRSWLRSRDKEKEMRQKFLAALSEAFPDGTFETWPQCRLLLPHVEPWVNTHLKEKADIGYWATILTNAAWYLKCQKVFIQAEILARRSVAANTDLRGRRHPLTRESTHVLIEIWTSGYTSLPEDAEETVRMTLEADVQQHGPASERALSAWSQLGMVYYSQRRYDKAEEIHRWVVQKQREALGSKNLATLVERNKVAMSLAMQGKLKDAEQIYRQVLSIQENDRKKEDPELIMVKWHLGVVLKNQERYEEAREFLQGAVEDCEKVFGEGHSGKLDVRFDLAQVFQWQEKYEQAEQILQDILENLKGRSEGSHLFNLSVRHSLAVVKLRQGKSQEAELIFEEVLAGREKLLAEDHLYSEDTLATVECLAFCYWKQGRYDAAFDMYRRAYDGYERLKGPHHSFTLDCREQFEEMLQERRSVYFHTYSTL
ncbi:Nephrocystin-3 [Orbilia brochopaga]|nr:Nephrocystin-3 [Drechslerella brochopaga]